MNRKKYVFSFLLFLFVSTGIQAQTLEQLARENFLAGRYEAAKPQLKRCLKTAPKDSRINFWYGACCIETGETEEAYSYLKYAADHKIQNAYRYLGQYYYLTGNFADAVDALETYLEVASSSDPAYADTQKFLQDVRAKQRFMRRVEKVIFVDSLVIDKASFLAGYHQGSESGKISTYDDYFQKTTGLDCTVFVSEMGNKIYYSCPTDSGTIGLYTSYRMTNEWSKPTALQGLLEQGDSNYPFMLSDGTTFYFSNNNPDGVGGYDIYVTRYNPDTDRFLKPDNAGLPFNSPANDYMMVVDELNGIGWFASDRRQPEDKVCIYTFIWKEGGKEYYDTDQDDINVISRAADIISIEESQTDEDAVRQARQTLLRMSLSNDDAMTAKSSKGEFTFILDDLTDYHRLSDFRCPEAKEAYEEYLAAKDEFSRLEKSLSEWRDKFADATSGQRVRLEDDIRAAEAQYEQIAQELPVLERKTRNAEKTFLSR